MLMRAITSAFAMLVGLLACTALPARAEIGPCKPDSLDGLTCGSGVGAARVIDNTQSPDKRLAFAWRVPDADVAEQPGDYDTIELLLLRLSDGAILGKSETGYWDTGHTHSNNRLEEVTWSPDGRLAARIFQTRFATVTFELFALGAKDEFIGLLDLQKIVEPAVRERLKRQVRDADGYSFSVSGDHVKLGNDGVMRMSVMMWVPKSGPEEYYNVTLRIARGDKTVRARITSIARGHEPK